MFTLAFLKGLAERAIKTFAQALVGYIAGGTIGIFDVDWRTALSAAVLATIASILTSVGNANFTAGTPADNPNAPDGLTTVEPDTVPVAADTADADPAPAEDTEAEASDAPAAAK